ncbi:hypothetical protein EJ06DRAFT_252729 [Trichodelitschia bisporula]|uniref:RNA-dependent RNA polymerase n=1 Tax=Trichodelitschia bisporula TaxID=703511 RepID=A0A6G1HJH1_9PEZI|nr:hypothetical protein EJ06DRAFT_252729 [Trichodelitschia bisporula]
MATARQALSASPTRANTSTPRGKSHHEINAMINKLNVEYGLGLPLRNTEWSPRKGLQSQEERCVECIKFLFFSSHSELCRKLQDFRNEAVYLPPEQRLPCLIRHLRTVHPGGGPVREDNRRAKTPISSFGERLSSAGLLQLNQSWKSPTQNRSPAKSNVRRETEITDEDEEFATPPQSPTLMVREAAAVRSARKSAKRASSSASSHKRRSDGGFTEHSPKQARGLDGKYIPTIVSVGNDTSPKYTTARQSDISSASNDAIYISAQGSARPSSSGLLSSVSSDFRAQLIRLAQAGPLSTDLLSLVSSDFRELLVSAVPPPPPPPFDFRREVTPVAPVPEQTPSPQKRTKHVQVRDFPSQGLCFDDPQTPQTAYISTRVRLELTRLALHNKVALAKLLPGAPGDMDTYAKMWQFLEGKAESFGLKLPQKGNARAYEQAKPGQFEGVTLKGKMSFAGEKGPLCELTVDAIELEKSCRFQRAFGCDRFFYLLVPQFDQPPERLKSQRQNLKEAFLEWLHGRRYILGRTWEAVHVEVYKNSKVSKFGPATPKMKYGYRVVLFATKGPGLQNKSVDDLVNWFMPLDRNLHLPFTKAFARLELGFSRTTPTIVFDKPAGQVRDVPDIMASYAIPEARDFDDPNLDWSPIYGSRDIKQVSMNDGCSRISLGACRLIWAKLGMTGPLPSVMQARINGAKGVWIRSAPADSTSPDHLDIWIEINESQRKFKPHPEDDDPDKFDPNRWTFETVTWERSALPSNLYVGFLPIFEERGVPHSAIEGLMNGLLNIDRQELLSAIKDPAALRCWLGKNFSLMEEKTRAGSAQMQSGWPSTYLERLILLLESGFVPGQNLVIGDLVIKNAEIYFARALESLGVRLARSTNVIGIADPTGTLLPGEIHLGFSEPWSGDEDYYSFLNGREVLVARHPTLRSADIQKVRTVHRPELAYLTNVVVFPSTGCIPLASKLQGGDYDGDNFWICWEPALVSNFRNAPVQLNTPPPEDFGIRVDRRTLADVLRGPRGVRNFLSESFAFRSQEDLLGIETTKHEQMAYAENSIRTPAVVLLADLHDYLIDSAKNGYTMDFATYKVFVDRLPRTTNRPVIVPAYKSVMKAPLQRTASSFENSFDTSFGCGASSTPRARRPKPRHDHIVDRVFFECLQPHIDETFVLLKRALVEGVETFDVDLPGPFLVEKAAATAAGDVDVLAELAHLDTALREVQTIWARRWTTSRKKDMALYDVILGECVAAYRAIVPRGDGQLAQRLGMRRLATRYMPGAYTDWELIRAARFFAQFFTKEKLVWPLVGRELCFIKAHAVGGARVVVEPVWTMYRTRRMKMPVEEVASEEEDDYFSTVEE